MTCIIHLEETQQITQWCVLIIDDHVLYMYL